MKPVLSAIFVFTAAALPSAAAAARFQAPLGFEANQGQADPAVRYFSRGSRHVLFVTGDGLVLSARPRAGAGVAIRTLFPGARAGAAISASGEQTARMNYYFGSDPRRWISGIPRFSRVEYRDLYPGIDLALYGNGGRLEYDFVVAPGADPRRIRLRFEGVDSLSIAPDGALVLGTVAGEIRERKPVIYQPGARRTSVTGRFVKTGPREAAFELGAYDRTRRLVIDPVLEYSTLLGGNYLDEGDALTVDGQGNAYIAGLTQSPAFPYSIGTSTTPSGLDDLFVAKFNTDGSQLLWAAFVGSAPDGYTPELALDPSGNVCLLATTSYTNFPVTTGAVQRSFAGNLDAAVARLSPSGALLNGTYLGGTGTEFGQSIAAGADGSIYVALDSNSPAGFGLGTGARNTGNRGGRDVVAIKLASDLSRIVYQAVMGGGGDDVPHGIKVDSSGAAYFSGRTSSTDLPATSGAAQARNAGGNDAFAAKLSADGATWNYITYLGGSNDDLAYGEAVDLGGNSYFVVVTSSTNFPVTSGANQTTYAGGTTDLAVVKLNPTGTALVYSSYLGGNDEDDAGSSPIAVDSAGNAYVAGGTFSKDFPNTAGTLESLPAQEGAFIAKFTGTGQLASATFLGGFDTSAANSVAVDAQGHVYVTGFDYTGYLPSSNFPITPNAYQANASDCLANDQYGCYHAFLSKIDFSVEVPAGPRVYWNGVVDAAAYGGVLLSPQLILAIYGTGLGATSPTQLQVDAAGNIATQLNGTSVLLNGTPLPMIYASATQVSAVVTQSALEAQNSATAQLTVCYNGQCAPQMVFTRYESDSALFTADSSGAGQGSILNADLSVNSSANPAAKGSVIAIYGTGGGAAAGNPNPNQVTPPVQGQFRDVVAQVYIDSIQSTVSYAGPAPALVPGVFQINAMIPTVAHSGNVQVYVVFYDKADLTNPLDQTQTVTVAVR